MLWENAVFCYKKIVIELVTKLRNLRSTFNIAPSAPLRAQIAVTDEATRDVMAGMEEHIKRLARLDQLQLVTELPAQRGAARAVMAGLEIAVPLEGLIDFDKERARLERELTKLGSEYEGLERRLANQDFISRAALTKAMNALLPVSSSTIRLFGSASGVSIGAAQSFQRYGFLSDGV